MPPLKLTKTMVFGQRAYIAMTWGIISMCSALTLGACSSSSNDADAFITEVEETEEIKLEDNGPAQSLISPEAWQAVEAQNDSFASHRPDKVNCPDNAWYIEDGAIEVVTGFCDYLALSQAIASSINPGDKLHIVLWHGDLRFEEPTSAHVALSIGTQILWERNLSIPTDAFVFDETVTADFYAEQGQAVEFHLHNHGFNTWKLLSVELLSN